MAKLSKDMEIQPAIRALLKLTTHEEIEAFMDGERRKSIQKEAIARIAALSRAHELPEMQIDKGEAMAATGPEGEQPLNGTSRPATKKEAKAIAEAAAANRPHAAPVARINPRSKRERTTDREGAWLREMRKQVDDLLQSNIQEIRAAYDEAIDERDADKNDKKFTYPVGIRVVICGQAENTWDITSKISFAVKHSDERTEQVRSADPDNDLVDMAEAKG